MGTENCKLPWLPDMADYHWDPGYLKLAKGNIRIENGCSLNIHQRDGHYNKRCIQHCMSCMSYSACKKVSLPNDSSSTMLISIFPIKKLNILNVGLVVKNAKKQGTVKERLDSTVLHTSIEVTKISL